MEATGRRSPRLTALLALLFTGQAVGAEALPREDAFLEEMPVVLSVARLSQPQDEAPAAVTVIDRQMIRDSGAWDLAEVFRLVPGMYVAYHATRDYITDSTVSYHGMTDAYARRMQVLVDGRSIYSPLFGGVAWSDLPLALDDIERIEVIRGPNSAMYGANSFLGIINIITRHPAEAQGSLVSLSAGRSRNELVARHGGRSGDLTYRLTLGYRNDAGLDKDIHDPIRTNFPTNKYDNKKVRQVNFRANYALTARDDLEFQFGYSGGDREEGEDDSTFYPRYKGIDNHFEMLRWNRQLNGGDAFSVQFYHSHESAIDQPFPTDPLYAGLTFNGDVVADRYDLEAQHTVSPTDATRLVWGGSVRMDKTYWPFYLGTTSPVVFHLSRLFANLEWRARPDLVFNVGAMVERNSFTGTDITPRFAANWHVVPGHTLRASVSRATRTPSLFEQKADVRVTLPPFQAVLRYGTDDLRPERVTSSEIGYLGKLGAASVDLRVFRDDFSDLAASYKTDPCTWPGVAQPGLICLGGSNFTIRNSGNAVLKGVEGEVKWPLSPRTHLTYGFSHIRVASRGEDGQGYSSAAPTNSQSLMLTHQFGPDWRGSLVGYQVGENTMLADGRFVNSYRRWDARLARAFRTGNARGELSLMVQNLGDERYEEYRWDNRLPGRSAWANLRVEWP